jgi:hypothetical protein
MACVHPLEQGSQSEFYECSNAPAGLENGGRILELLNKDTELQSASQSVSHSLSRSVRLYGNRRLAITFTGAVTGPHSEPNK